MKPVISHATSSHPGEPTVRDISALTMKIPEPIIDPTTIAVESTRLRLFVNDEGSFSDINNNE